LSVFCNRIVDLFVGV